MKRIPNIDEKVLGINPDEPDTDLPTYRVILRLIGNQKATTADNSRRVGRIIKKLRDKGTAELILENDDMNFLVQQFEANGMSLSGWMQTQILEVLDAAEKYEPPKAA